LIGKSVLNSILKEQLDYEISALIRPDTALERFSSFRSSVELAQIDLADTEKLYDYLKNNTFDVVMHIGALRGGRKFPPDTYIKANYKSTEQFVEHCQKHGSRFIYCSSVGVLELYPKNYLPQ
jgi:nucleoside-diphosphate-sugar epimerase